MTTPQISSPKEYAPIVKHAGYNQVMRIGNRVEISGQGGWDYNFENLYSFSYTSYEDEFRKAFENVERVLNTAGASWKDVYSVTSYHVGLGKTMGLVTGELSKLFKEFIGEREPLWTCLGVDSLAVEGMRIEIVVTAYTK